MEKKYLKLFSLMGALLIISSLSIGFAINSNESNVQDIEVPKILEQSNVTELQDYLYEIVKDGNYLKKGDTGVDVAALQLYLSKKGYYSGAINSNFDETTEAALKNYQKDLNITANGILDLKTVNTLFNKDSCNKYLKTKTNSKLENYINNFNLKNKNLYDKTKNQKYSNKKTNNYKYSDKKAYAKTTKYKYSNKKTKKYSNKKTYAKTTKYKYSNKKTNNYKYSNKKTGYSTSFNKGNGVGDCWDNSNNLYTKLSNNGQKARIVQYKTSYSPRHRSVQVYNNGKWNDYNYKANGYAKRYYATNNKPGFKVIS